MADNSGKNFFSTVAKDGNGSGSDESDNCAPDLSALARGPTFVKSQAKTLFQDQLDIEQSRMKKAKVTFAKPKPKVNNNQQSVQQQPKTQEISEERKYSSLPESFSRSSQSKSHLTAAEREIQGKVKKLEEQINEVYGSKAYAMLQKMSQKKNKKDLQIENILNKNENAASKNDHQSENNTDAAQKQEEMSKFSLGQGIGKHGQGILNPIQVELRPAQGGIGYVQKHTQSVKRRGKNHEEQETEGGVAHEIDMDIHDKAGEKKREEQAKEQMQRLDAEDKAFLELFQGNKKSHRKGEKRVNFRQEYDQMQNKFKTEYGFGEASEKTSAASRDMGDAMKKLNIIDMTGGSVQIQSSQINYGQKTQIKSEQKHKCSLLLKKVLKIKDEAKFNVKALVQKEEYQENLKLHLKQELQTLQESNKGSALVLQELKDFEIELQSVLTLAEGKQDIQSVTAKCTDLSERFPTLYQEHQVSHRVASVILKTHLVPFDFAQKALMNFDTFLAVRNLLTIGCSPTQIDISEAREKNTVFMQLVFDTYWTGPFRQHVMGSVQMRESGGACLRDTLSQWSALMPDQVLRKLVDQVIMPKLSQAFQTYSVSKTDATKIEDWLIPWCEIIGKKNMKQLFEVVKVQLVPIFSDKKAFKSDHALEVLEPWVSVLDSTEVIKFANRYIYPKLTASIKRLEVDPSDQKLQPLQLLFRFTKVLPQVYSMKQANCILKEHLVPKLLLTLQTWLEIIESDNGDELEEVLVWYEGWKNFLVKESGIIDERGKIEETFYLMMLMLEEKLHKKESQ